MIARVLWDQIQREAVQLQNEKSKSLEAPTSPADFSKMARNGPTLASSKNSDLDQI